MRQTDSRGFNTYYDVDDETSRNMTVTDRCGNKTSYEYDDSGRTTKVTSRDSNGTALAHVDYGYDLNDNLVDITRGDGMSYNLAYNSFNRLESIAIDGMPRPLVAYNYKEGSGRLKEIEYANGSVMHVSYNRFGHPICEFWTDSCNCITAFYRYVYDNSGNLVRSVDFVHKIEYTYTYEEGKIVRSAVNEIEVNGYESVLSRTLKHTILYFYNKEGGLKEKIIFDDSDQYSYTRNSYDENGNVSTVAEVCGSCATITSSEDGLGRKTSESISFENGVVTRDFHYRSGAVTQEHIANNKVCGTATTNLVSKIHFSNGRVIEYWYDGEERITRIADSCEGETFYTYDALGQLISETKNTCPECSDCGTTVAVTYDNYGNILTKGNHTYGYDNVLWKDRLTSFDGQSITYDEQGNPISYLGHNLTWEKGRQLKSFDNNTYTYNANGIRTSKTVDGIRHDYVVDGANILKETWLDNTLIPIYNNDLEVIGIYYNCEPYYFYKNLQNDVIGIADADGTEVVTYTYDAWGVCTVLKDISGVGLANINPYRYRSYYYDVEVGMYYLQSRYYDPTVCRFINADEFLCVITSADMLQYNSFSYCFNDAVNMVDLEGFYPFDLFKTPDAAVKDFAYNYYNVSLYIRREISSIVYTIKKSNKTYYSYTPYVIHDFHSSIIRQGEHWIPKEGRFFAGIHTHTTIKSCFFSDADWTWARKNLKELYGVFADRTVWKIREVVYPKARNPIRWRDKRVFKNMSFKKLDRDVGCRLRRRYKHSFEEHQKLYCEYSCSYLAEFGTQL